MSADNLDGLGKVKVDWDKWNLTEENELLKSQLAILREALENIDNEEIAEFDHIYQIKTFKRVVSDALKKCFGEEKC